jgi:hypothetical protein
MGLCTSVHNKLNDVDVSIVPSSEEFNENIERLEREHGEKYYVYIKSKLEKNNFEKMIRKDFIECIRDARKNFNISYIVNNVSNEFFRTRHLDTLKSDLKQSVTSLMDEYKPMGYNISGLSVLIYRVHTNCHINIQFTIKS